MLESGSGQRVRRWLERFGFTDDPFVVYEADQERAALPGLFIDRPYVMRMVGDPARPQSAFLLAHRGTGKTATREIIAYEHIHGRCRRRALPVRYCDFGFLLGPRAPTRRASPLAIMQTPSCVPPCRLWLTKCHPCSLTSSRDRVRLAAEPGRGVCQSGGAAQAATIRAGRYGCHSLERSLCCRNSDDLD